MTHSLKSSTKLKPPYWVVVFTSQRTLDDESGYQSMAARMSELALAQPGCLGYDSVRDDHGFAVTVSYWDSEAAIKAWHDHPEHLQAQALGREKWYSGFDLHVARVERSYGFEK